MENDELKTALLSKKPVMYKLSASEEIEYKYVSGIIYRAENGRIVVTAEITDKNGQSVTICKPEKLKYKGG